ncbi:hypothetical protein BD311DRAFT_130734 [Dichomitus squalens]|uniref:Uncharacterized protein n=1 Tax=Dichomitus squalens TaxID=114155 RepID=A0A4Q9M8A6_9APHY|nr:hypothetical protein BD311DRAFT_130734 [Dichomitus squalens]
MHRFIAHISSQRRHHRDICTSPSPPNVPEGIGEVTAEAQVQSPPSKAPSHTNSTNLRRSGRIPRHAYLLLKPRLTQCTRNSAYSPTDSGLDSIIQKLQNLRRSVPTRQSTQRLSDGMEQSGKFKLTSKGGTPARRCNQIIRGTHSSISRAVQQSNATPVPPPVFRAKRREILYLRFQIITGASISTIADL